jgi:hypothetical protein
MPHLAHIANLWSLVGHPSSAKEWSLKKKINAIAAAGMAVAGAINIFRKEKK